MNEEFIAKINKAAFEFELLQKDLIGVRDQLEKELKLINGLITAQENIIEICAKVRRDYENEKRVC